MLGTFRKVTSLITEIAGAISLIGSVVGLGFKVKESVDNLTNAKQEMVDAEVEVVEEVDTQENTGNIIDEKDNLENTEE